RGAAASLAGAMLGKKTHTRRRGFMEYRTLGRSPLKISPITLGTMLFGGATGTDEALHIERYSRDAGINSLDTADIYSSGEAEKVVAQGIKGERDFWLLASKVANPEGDGPNQTGFSRKWVMEGVEAS